MSDKYVLDACSLIAHFNQEKGADKVKSIITRAVDGNSTVFVHRLNLFEVYYDLLRSVRFLAMREKYNVSHDLAL
jgi:PIN domain nuclease of toxin-antitoxin system